MQANQIFIGCITNFRYCPYTDLTPNPSPWERGTSPEAIAALLNKQLDCILYKRKNVMHPFYLKKISMNYI